MFYVFDEKLASQVGIQSNYKGYTVRNHRGQVVYHCPKKSEAAAVCERFNSMTKQPANLPPRHPGEDDRAYEKRIAHWLIKDTARSKGDDKEWTGSPPFHLDKSND